MMVSTRTVKLLNKLLCISRYLWWGHRIQAYYCDDCGELMVELEEPVKCKKCGSPNIRQDEDVLDTWFS